MNTPKSQQGMTAIGVVSILALVGFVLMLTVKVLPSYLDHFKVSAALKGLTSDIRAKDAGEKKIKSLILKKLQVDDVEYLGSKDIVITKTSSGLNVRIQFENRVPMFSNIDAMVKFDESVDLPR